MTGKPERSKSKLDFKRKCESNSKLKKTPFLKKRNLASGELELSRFDGLNFDEAATDIVDLISSEVHECNVKGIKSLRRMLVQNLSETLIDEIIDVGLVPKVVEYLRTLNILLQFEAAWVITNLATGDTRQTRYLVEAGAVDALVKLLLTDSEIVQQQSAWALGNIANDSYEFRDFVIANGAIEAIIHVLETTDKVPVLQTVTWLLIILCDGSKDFKRLSATIPLIRDLLKHSDTEVVGQSCWSLACLSNGTDRIKEVLDNNVAPYLVQLLSRETEIIEPALQVIGNIVTGDELPTQVMLDSGVLTPVVKLIDSSDYSIRKDACWIISNILAGTKRQIQAVIDSNPFPSMLFLLTKDGIKTKKEVVWAIRNITTGGTHDQIKHLVNQGVIDKLCGALSVVNAEIVQVSLRALEVILRLGEQESKYKGIANQMAVAVEECNGIEALETLLSHDYPEIYRKAYDLLEQYFANEE